MMSNVEVIFDTLKEFAARWYLFVVATSPLAIADDIALTASVAYSVLVCLMLSLSEARANLYRDIARKYDNEDRL